MIQGEAVIRKWGNSFGITLPKELVKREGMKEEERVAFVVLKKRNPLNETFGMFKGKIKKSTQEIKDELRRELYHD